MSENSRLPENTLTVHANNSVYPRILSSSLKFRKAVIIKISISYPHINVFGNPRVSNLLNNFYRISAKNYRNKIYRDAYGKAVSEYLFSQKNLCPFSVWRGLQNFEVSYGFGNFISVYTDRSKIHLQKRVNATRSAATYAAGTGSRLRLEDFFEDSYYKTVIFTYITDDIKRRKKEGDKYFFSDYPEKVFRFLDEENFYLTENGFAVFYQPGTLAEYAEGIPVFTIPYDKFGTAFKKRLFV